MTLYHGIRSIPDEIDSHIFEIGHAKILLDKGPRVADLFAIEVSHVCGRFRAIALDTPRLWSVISTSQTPRQMDAFGSRSKSVRLTVLVRPSQHELRRSTCCQIMEAAAPNHHRWMELQFESCAEEDLDVLTTYPDLIFPALQRLTLTKTCTHRQVDPRSAIIKI